MVYRFGILAVDKFYKAINISQKDWKRERAKIPAKLGNEAENYFKDSWRKQGWDNKSWKARKYTTRKNAGKAILVQSGVLRRSFRVNARLNKVVVINDTPYGVYHNYGTNKMPQRKFMGRSSKLDKKSIDLIQKIIKRALK